MALINITPRGYTCTPSSLLASVPCLDCLSETELLAVIVGIFVYATDDTVPAVLDKSACFNCMTEKQMLQAVVTILGNEILGEDFSLPLFLDKIKCIRRCSNRKQLLAAILWELCNHFPPIIR